MSWTGIQPWATFCAAAIRHNHTLADYGTIRNTILWSAGVGCLMHQGLPRNHVNELRGKSRKPNDWPGTTDELDRTSRLRCAETSDEPL